MGQTKRCTHPFVLLPVRLRGDRRHREPLWVWDGGVPFRNGFADGSDVSVQCEFDQEPLDDFLKDVRHYDGPAGRSFARFIGGKGLRLLDRSFEAFINDPAFLASFGD
jgi:hypothetical protein